MNSAGLTTLMLCFALPALAQEVGQPSGRSLPMPGEKQPVLLPNDEKSPFRGIETRPATADGALIGGESEESRLRAAFLRLPVRGVAIGDNGNASAVVGSMSLSVGDELPSLFPNQVERVVVLEISESQMTLGFVEHDGSTDKRSIKKVFNVAPRVRFALPTDVDAVRNSGGPLPLRGVVTRESDESLE